MADSIRSTSDCLDVGVTTTSRVLGLASEPLASSESCHSLLGASSLRSKLLMAATGTVEQLTDWCDLLGAQTGGMAGLTHCNKP